MPDQQRFRQDRPIKTLTAVVVTSARYEHQKKLKLILRHKSFRVNRNNILLVQQLTDRSAAQSQLPAVIQHCWRLFQRHYGIKTILNPTNIVPSVCLLAGHRVCETRSTIPCEGGCHRTVSLIWFCEYFSLTLNKNTLNVDKGLTK